MKLKAYDFQTVSIDYKRHYPVPLVDKIPKEFQIKSDRLYLSEVKKYLPYYQFLPSVTTVCSNTDPPEKKEFFKKWRLENPNDDSLNRGNWVHAKAEDFQAGKPIEIDSDIWADWWYSLEQFLVTVEQFILTESVVWFPGCYAGRMDSVGIVDGIVTLLDWKTSKPGKGNNKGKPKKREWIEGYLMQAGAYTTAFNHVYKDTGVQIEQAKIVIAVPGYEPQIFTLDKTELEFYLDMYRDRFRMYKKMGLLIQ